jgi:hypothetical protein
MRPADELFVSVYVLIHDLTLAGQSRCRPVPGLRLDTSALPVKHPSRVRGPGQRTGPGNDPAARGTAVLVPPGKKQRTMTCPCQRLTEPA